MRHTNLLVTVIALLALGELLLFNIDIEMPVGHRFCIIDYGDTLHLGYATSPAGGTWLRLVDEVDGIAVIDEFRAAGHTPDGHYFICGCSV